MHFKLKDFAMILGINIDITEWDKGKNYDFRTGNRILDHADYVLCFLFHRSGQVI
jgi:hypothetical protein